MVTVEPFVIASWYVNVAVPGVKLDTEPDTSTVPPHCAEGLLTLNVGVPFTTVVTAALAGDSPEQLALLVTVTV